MAMSAALRAELVGLFEEVLDANEHTLELASARHAVGGCSRLQSVLAGREAVLGPVLRRLELRAVQDAVAAAGRGGGDGQDEPAPDELPFDDAAPDAEPSPEPEPEPEPVVPRVSVREQRRRDVRAK